VKLDRIGSYVARHFDSANVGIDEVTHANAGILKTTRCVCHVSATALDVEPSFGRDLGSLFGNQRYLWRRKAKRDADHFFFTRGFEIEVRRNRRCEQLDIRVLYVPAVFAQMRRNPVGASPLTHCRRLDWIWLNSASRLPQRRDVIYVHVEP
jgi:hypothetical protein